MDVREELELRPGRESRPEELWRWMETTSGIERRIAPGLRESAASADWLHFEVLRLAGSARCRRPTRPS